VLGAGVPEYSSSQKTAINDAGLPILSAIWTTLLSKRAS
jgi:hypothetical protein